MCFSIVEHDIDESIIGDMSDDLLKDIFPKVGRFLKVKKILRQFYPDTDIKVVIIKSSSPYLKQGRHFNEINEFASL